MRNNPQRGCQQLEGSATDNTRLDNTVAGSTPATKTRRIRKSKRLNPNLILEEGLEAGRSPSPPSSRPTQHSGFLNLPAELRLEVYSYLIPRDALIWFECYETKSNKRKVWAWDGLFQEKPSKEEERELGMEVLGMRLPEPHVMPSRASLDRWGREYRIYREEEYMKTGLLSVCKIINEEVKDILYRSYTFRFSTANLVGEHSTHPLLGPFFPRRNRQLLRFLRHIDIDIAITLYGIWCIKDYRRHLAHWVSTMNRHASDSNGNSLLKSLHIRITFPLHRPQERSGLMGPIHYKGHPSSWHDTPRINTSDPTDDFRGGSKYRFSLESLVALRGVQSVRIIGVPEWYAKCLALRIQGKGGELLEKGSHEGPDKRRIGKVISRRSWAVWDWGAFGKRNGVNVPEGWEAVWV